ncbi:MAG: potassium-transporting ATPase subunit KdpA [Chloroflexi bacterium]|nr:potassium-transporting ATPase subunit KdpA [Chloroflexota bacterium]
MTANGLMQVALYLVILIAAARPLGTFMARVYEGKPILLDRVLGPVERLIYRAGGVRPDAEMNWKVYAFAVLLFNGVGLLVVYVLQRVQGSLPLNPQDLPGVTSHSSFNTAVSFASNTNWQGYSGEVTMSYLTQMLALTVQNFVSAATGMAVLVALIRGIARRSAGTIGNFWVDMVRSTLYILLPLSIILTLGLVSQGVVQTFDNYKTVHLLQPMTDAEGNTITEQLLALGPAASQIAIKQLGTNGGGFFNVNSAHPFENPNPFTNLLEMLSILLIPAALCYTFGKMVGDTRQGWAILAAMTIMLTVMIMGAYAAEAQGNPRIGELGVDQTADDTNPGGNMEGKEVRFGVANSTIWATTTTAASNGSVNSMHDSYTPLGGLVPLFMMQMSETIFGGVGSGLYGMLAFVIVSVFIAGLMVGRTPEYLGKKIEAYEIKMVSIVILIMPLIVLVGTAVAVLSDDGKATIYNPEAHGFSEVLYAFTSAGNNNGSAFAGLGANTEFYNTALGFAMLLARYWIIVPILALAGSLANKKIVPVGAGTLPTHTPLFVVLLLGIVILVGVLSFIPALALGPIVEHLMTL